MKRGAVFQRLRCSELAILAGHGSFDGSAVRKCHDIGYDSGVRKVDVCTRSCASARSSDKRKETTDKCGSIFARTAGSSLLSNKLFRWIITSPTDAVEGRFSVHPRLLPEPVMRMNKKNGKSLANVLTILGMSHLAIARSRVVNWPA